MSIVKPIGTLDRSIGKSQITDLAEQNAQAIIDNGKYDLLKVYVEMKRYELYLKTIMDKLKDEALKRALDLGEKSFEMDNAKVTIIERTVWHFDSDPRWQALGEDLNFIKQKQKERETLLKDIAPGEIRQVVDPDTGEVEDLTAPLAETVLSLMIKL